MKLISQKIAESQECATQYPLLLVHGVGVRDNKRHRIWGRIPRSLQGLGATVYVGNQDGWATMENNAVQLHEIVASILLETGANKVNVIAHSKGGLDTRQLIKMYRDEGRGDDIPIASLTTIATPHHGSQTIDYFYKHFRFVFRVIAFFIDGVFRLAGDKHVDFYTACKDLSSSHMQAFNAKQPELDSILCQQYGSSLRSLGDSVFSFFTYPVVSRIEGENDGLVALKSTNLNNFCGEIITTSGRGISHAGLVDITMKPFRKKARAGAVAKTAGQTPTDESTLKMPQQKDIPPLLVDDILDFYISLVSDLRLRGY